jgi:hypothetical protein
MTSAHEMVLRLTELENALDRYLDLHGQAYWEASGPADDQWISEYAIAFATLINLSQDRITV